MREGGCLSSGGGGGRGWGGREDEEKRNRNEKEGGETGKVRFSRCGGVSGQNGLVGTAWEKASVRGRKDLGCVPVAW